MSLTLTQHSRVCVQQPCSNPSECADMWGKVHRENSGFLQLFCKAPKTTEKSFSSLIRTRSLLRVQAGPRLKSRNSICRKTRSVNGGPGSLRGLCAATRCWRRPYLPRSPLTIAFCNKGWNHRQPLKQRTHHMCLPVFARFYFFLHKTS